MPLCPWSLCPHHLKEDDSFWQSLFIYSVLIPGQAIAGSGKMVFILNILVCCYQRYGLPSKAGKYII